MSPQGSRSPTVLLPITNKSFVVVVTNDLIVAIADDLI